jgi:hypothetical protein
MESWKAIQPRQNAKWELYDLAQDVSEQHDLAAKQPEMLAKLQAFAKEAHEPVEEGTFFDRDIHEKDRRAKYGGKAPPRRGRVNSLTKKGLLSNKGWKISRVSSEARGNRKLAAHAIDGDSRTHWHTQFQPQLDKHPHELVIDLGAEKSISGFRYLARQDGGWNGAIAKCEFAVSNSADEFGEPVAQATFKKTKFSQEVKCDPVKGRYVLIRVLSEVNNGPWASIAELGVVGK